MAIGVLTGGGDVPGRDSSILAMFLCAMVR